MEYSLAIENAPESVPGGTGLLLVHPSTTETDRVDTDFLRTDTDHLLVVSTRTSAREVRQKLEHYEVDEDRATILDTLSIERGYTRRPGEQVRYVQSPDDVDSIVAEVREFLDSHDGKRRITVDSITELIYYADEEHAREAVTSMLALLDEYDAVGLFHLARGVHDATVRDRFRDLFDGVIELGESGSVSVDF